MKFPNAIVVDKNKKVLCVGLLCLDIISTCKVYPTEGTDQRCLNLRWQKGGNAANTSTIIGMLGYDAEYYGTVAHNSNPTENLMADFVINELKKYVCLDNIVIQDNCKVPCSQVIINAESGSRTIIHSGNMLPELTLENFLSIKFVNYSLVHFEGRNVEEVIKMMKFLNKHNESIPKDKQIFISMEAEKPARQNQVDMMPFADLVVISQDFAEAKQHKNAVDAVIGFKDHCKPGAFVVCAWGDSGAACGVVQNNDDVIMVPAAVPDQVVDTLGAGDTFLGGLIFALVQGKTLPTAVKFACQVAGHKVSAYGYSHVKNFLA